MHAFYSKHTEARGQLIGRAAGDPTQDVRMSGLEVGAFTHKAMSAGLVLNYGLHKIMRFGFFVVVCLFLPLDAQLPWYPPCKVFPPFKALGPLSKSQECLHEHTSSSLAFLKPCVPLSANQCCTDYHIETVGLGIR